jgi:hypothetical protein
MAWEMASFILGLGVRRLGRWLEWFTTRNKRRTKGSGTIGEGGGEWESERDRDRGIRRYQMGEGTLSYHHEF